MPIFQSNPSIGLVPGPGRGEAQLALAEPILRRAFPGVWFSENHMDEARPRGFPAEMARSLDGIVVGPWPADATHPMARVRASTSSHAVVWALPGAEGELRAIIVEAGRGGLADARPIRSLFPGGGLRQAWRRRARESGPLRVEDDAASTRFARSIAEIFANESGAVLHDVGLRQGAMHPAEAAARLAADAPLAVWATPNVFGEVLARGAAASCIPALLAPVIATADVWAAQSLATPGDAGAGPGAMLAAASALLSLNSSTRECAESLMRLLVLASRLPSLCPREFGGAADAEEFASFLRDRLSPDLASPTGGGRQLELVP